MLLKKVLNRKDKNTGKEFYRWDITLDPNIVDSLGWKKGDKLEYKIQRNLLTIRRKK